jgi:hypothetical protein
MDDVDCDGIYQMKLRSRGCYKLGDPPKLTSG